MPQLIYDSGAHAGHDWLQNGGVDFSPVLKTGTKPAAGTYRIDSAEISFLHGGDYAAVRQSGTGTTISAGGTTVYSSSDWLGGCWDIGFAVSCPDNLIALIEAGVHLSGGWQIGSGTYCRVTINFTMYASSFTLSKSTMDAGTAQTVTIVPNDWAFTHKIIYSLGSESATRSTAAWVTTDSWTVPLSWLNQMKNAESATVYVTLQTYAGGVLIGTWYGNFQLTCPASVVPAISTTSAAPGGTTTIGAGIYVKGKTGVTASMSGVTASYATIAATGISVGGYGTGFSGSGTSLTTSVLPKSGAVMIIFWVRDSRGRMAYAYKEITVLDYAFPSLTTAKAYRVTDAGVASPTATQGMWSFVMSRKTLGGSYWTKVEVMRAGAVLATSTAASGSGWIVTGAGSTAHLTVELPTEYQIDFRVSDSYASGVIVSVILPSAMAALSFNGLIDGAAFGMIAQKSKAVEVATDWELWYKGRELLGLVCDKLYPVGSIYMSAVSTSPASLFGGTWTQLKDRFLVGAGGTYTAAGGAATHTLKKAELPAIDPMIYLEQGGVGKNIPKGKGYILSGNWGWNGSTAIDGQASGVASGPNLGGSATAFSVLPPYTPVYMWKRTA